jgi:hypothetical protein
MSIAMKESRRLIAGALMLLCSGVVLAQTDTTPSHRDHTSSREAKRKLVFGIKGGFNNSNVFDQQTLNFVAKSKTGLAGGIFLAIPLFPLGGFLGIQPEVLLSQKGFSGTGVIANENYSIKRTTTYLDVPIQLQLKPFSFLFLTGGIQYSYLIKQQDELSYGSNYQQVTQEFNNDNIRKNILGLVAGGDVNLWHLVISGRAGWDIITNHGNGTSSTPRYKNLWLQATLGYRFY